MVESVLFLWKWCVALYFAKRTDLHHASLGIDHVSCGGTHDRYGKTIRLLDGAQRTSLLYRYSAKYLDLCVAIADAIFR